MTIIDLEKQQEEYCSPAPRGGRVAYAMRNVGRAAAGLPVVLVILMGCDFSPRVIGYPYPICDSGQDGEAPGMDAGTADDCSPAPDGGRP